MLDFQVVIKLRKMTFVFGYWPKRSKIFYGKSKKIIFLISIFFMLSLLGKIFLNVDRGGSFISAGLDRMLGEIPLSDSFLKTILGEGLPMLELKEAEYMSPVSIAASLLSAVTTVNMEDPKGLLESQFSYMEDMDIEAASLPYSETDSEQGAEGASETSSQGEDISEDETGSLSVAGNSKKENPAVSGDNPLVGIYNTHNAEKYANEKRGPAVKGESAGVVKVAEVLENTLEDKYKISTVRSQQIHDYPDWNLSYTKSKETGKSLLSKNPSIQLLLDIHRDAGLKEKHSVVINGREAAKVLIIVGSDQRLENPDWKKNKAFAEKVDAKIDKLYPGLSRGVRVQTGRYNQHLHPHAILLEIGNVRNSLAEAEVSAEMMANVISEVLKDISSNKL